MPNREVFKNGWREFKGAGIQSKKHLILEG